MIRLEKRPGSQRYPAQKAIVLALLLTFAAGCLIFMLLGVNPLTAYRAMFGSFSSPYTFSEILVKATPLIFTGLAVSVAAVMMLWNIGAEGQLVWGGIFTAGAALYLFPTMPQTLLLPLLVVASIMGGMFWAALAGILKARFKVNEILTTLLLNYVAIIYMEHLYYGPWRDPEGFGFPGTAKLPEAAELTRLLGTRVSLGFFLALFCAVLLYLLLKRSAWGYRIRVIGLEPQAAHYAGFSVARQTFIVMALSGALAGMAGMVEVCGIHHRLQTGLAAGYGYDGIIVAWLARLNPLAIPLAALALSALFVGGEQLQAVLGLPSTISLILEGTLLFGLLGGEALSRYRLVFTPLKGNRMSKGADDA